MQAAGHTYHLIDCGHGRRLEQVGPLVVDRPAPAATEAPGSPELWSKAHFFYDGHRSTAGDWQAHEDNLIADGMQANPDAYQQINCQHAGLQMQLGLLPSGQIGMFAEQSINWRLLQRMGRRNIKLNFINLFGYTGLSSIAARLGGHRLTHVDAARSAVARARRNAGLNLEEANDLRWLVEDAPLFVTREIKRGNSYNALILDPPAFGRGPSGQVWKIERDLGKLLQSGIELCQQEPDCIILSAHKPGWQAEDLVNILRTAGLPAGKFYFAQLKQHALSGAILRAGYCAWYFKATIADRMS